MKKINLNYELPEIIPQIKDLYFLREFERKAETRATKELLEEIREMRMGNQNYIDIMINEHFCFNYNVKYNLSYKGNIFYLTRED